MRRCTRIASRRVATHPYDNSQRDHHGGPGMVLWYLREFSGQRLNCRFGKDLVHWWIREREPAKWRAFSFRQVTYAKPDYS
jgi:hypothetical protein